jgi:hypothetical protein
MRNFYTINFKADNSILFIMGDLPSHLRTIQSEEVGISPRYTLGPLGLWKPFENDICIIRKSRLQLPAPRLQMSGNRRCCLAKKLWDLSSKREARAARARCAAKRQICTQRAATTRCCRKAQKIPSVINDRNKTITSSTRPHFIVAVAVVDKITNHC